MIDVSPRLGALLAGGAALVAFGLTAPAMADGANDPCLGHSYCPTDVGAPSGNGKGLGKAVGKPGAGLAGKADSKNPPGQATDGSDSNNGYECELNGNEGVGKTNPAHSGCADDDGYGYQPPTN